MNPPDTSLYSPTAPLAARWVAVGVGFNIAASSEPVDIEQLFIDTAPACPDNCRFFEMAVAWLIEYGDCVDPTRLRQLAAAELAHHDCAILGLLLETAIDAGAPSGLAAVLDVCEPAQTPQPLYDIDRGNSVMQQILDEEATAISRKWNLFMQPFEPHFRALLPGVAEKLRKRIERERAHAVS